jgi:hypothetical protein
VAVGTDEKRQRRCPIIVNEHHFFVAGAESLVMFVNEFVLSTQMVL